MRDDRHSGIETTGHLSGDRIALGIDASDMGHLMTILTDLYSDPELAVIREYATNARDAHIAAGNPDPIEVVTPTDMRPHLTIRDHGTGLSHDDIRTVYSRYGKTTKGDTNAQTGMLGLGGKSALTYAPQFMVTGVKDGRRIQVCVSRENDGTGAMTVVSDRPTDAPNGVEVTIPAERRSRIATKAAALFRHWPEGSVLLDGEPVAPLDGLWLNNNLCVVNGATGIDGNTVVMGGVAYPVDADALEVGTSYRHHLVAYLDIGDVHFPPNREALAYTDKTKARLAKLAEEFTEAARVNAQADIDAQPDGAAALAVALRWRASIENLPDVNYRGTTIPETYGSATPSWQAKYENIDPIWKCGARPAAYGRDASRIYGLTPDEWPGTVFIEDFDVQTLSPTARAKARKLIEDRGIEGVRRIVASSYPVPRPFVAESQIVSYADVKAVKLPTDAVPGGRPARAKGSYDGYRAGENPRYETTIPAVAIEDFTGTVYWTQGGQYSGAWTKAEALTAVASNWLLIALPDRRQAKFKRDFPKARELTPEVWGRMHDNWWRRVGDTTRSALGLYEASLNVAKLRRIEPSRVDDPRLKAMATLARHDVEAAQAKRAAFNGYATLGALPEPTAANVLDEQYPLFNDHTLRLHPDETYRYLNAEHAHLTRGAE